jgi:hypothetical protein
VAILAISAWCSEYLVARMLNSVAAPLRSPFCSRTSDPKLRLSAQGGLGWSRRGNLAVNLYRAVEIARGFLRVDCLLE